MDLLNFGSTNEPRSRCLYEDDDIGLSSERLYSVSWTKKCPQKCKALIVTSTSLSKAFVDVFLMKTSSMDSMDSIVGEIKESKMNPDEVQNIRVAVLRHVEGDVYHCHLEKHILFQNQNDFAEKLLNAFGKTDFQVIVLTSVLLGKYFGGGKDNELILSRYLKSSRWSFSAQDWRSLEQPNIVHGIPAAVLTYCEISAISCLLVVCYVDSNVPDSITLSGFHNFFKYPKLHEIVSLVDTKVFSKRLELLSTNAELDTVFI